MNGDRSPVKLRVSRRCFWQIDIGKCRAINCLMAEVMEGHMREHVLAPKEKPSEGQREAAEDIFQLINRYLK